MEKLLTTEELGELISVPVKTLADWRVRGIGPAYARIGRHVRYRPADVDDWLRTRTGTCPADVA